MYATTRNGSDFRHQFLREADASKGNFVEVLLDSQSDMGEGLLVVEGGRIRYVNEAFCRISGHSAAELTSLSTLSELIVPELRPIMEDRMRRCGETVGNRYETTILHKSGRCVDLEVVVESLREDDQPLQLVLARDFTERKRTEERLQSSLSSLLVLHEAARLLNSTLEQEEIGTRLLKTMHRVSDLSAAAVSLRDDDGRLRVLRADGPEGLWQAASNTPEAQNARHRALETKERQAVRLGQLEEGGPSLAGLCLPLVLRDRTTGLLEAYGYEALAKKPTVEVLESLARQAANALENARLHRELAERERRLQDLVGKQLAAREEERRRVACDIHDGLTQVAVAAHQSLQGYADDLPPGSPSDQARLYRALGLARQTVKEARRVIANLRPAVLDDLGLVAALRLRADALRAEGWEIGYDETLGEERLPAEIEATLYRVGQEALTNVRKHARTAWVKVTLRRLDNKVCLEIRDRGCGFDGRVISPQNGDPGEQMGLRGMRERIALLGGEFRIHSRPGSGTSVVAEIPLPRATPVQEEQAPGPQGTASPVRLLIADDHALVREGFQAMLAGEPDLEVVGEATDGREVLELCHRLQPDLVLMDVRMPEMDGVAATRAIKAECCATGILMLTAYENPDYLFEAVQAGAAGYVTKDAGKHELLSAMRGALGGKNPLNPELAMQLLRRLAFEGDGTTRPSLAKQSEPLPVALTPRELEVLRLVAEGQTNQQISRKLIVSPATVKVHVEHILAKLGVSDRTQAAVRASEAGLLGIKE